MLSKSFTKIQSFVEIGTPRNGWSLSSSSFEYFFEAIKLSASAASIKASLKRSSTTQFNCGFISLIRSMNDCTTVTLVI